MKKLAYGLIAGIMIVSMAGFTFLIPAQAEAGGARSQGDGGKPQCQDG